MRFGRTVSWTVYLISTKNIRFTICVNDAGGKANEGEVVLRVKLEEWTNFKPAPSPGFRGYKNLALPCVILSFIFIIMSPSFVAHRNLCASDTEYEYKCAQALFLDTTRSYYANV